MQEATASSSDLEWGSTSTQHAEFDTARMSLPLSEHSIELLDFLPCARDSSSFDSGSASNQRINSILLLSRKSRRLYSSFSSLATTFSSSYPSSLSLVNSNLIAAKPNSSNPKHSERVGEALDIEDKQTANRTIPCRHVSIPISLSSQAELVMLESDSKESSQRQRRRADKKSSVDLSTTATKEKAVHGGGGGFFSGGIAWRSWSSGGGLFCSWNPLFPPPPVPSPLFRRSPSIIRCRNLWS
ncbi:uncharacterized protein LOC110021886 [Phalaenopsis equestris]|uniref:uncharacterized protein LOC110021886 n=1 Tax=Phalaenopsis equestris TaxID=78828 RepID=UPI0009E48614|nr:uncharacterized protein LOC110021886 [Phalaenopsis equestris]